MRLVSVIVPRQTEPAGHRDGCQATRQLQQRQRIAARLGEDATAHPLVERPRGRRVQQHAGVRGAEPLHDQLRQAFELVLVAGLTQREHQADPLGQQPARDEPERLRGHPIQPLRVVDDAHQRLLLGHVSLQRQHGEPDEEPIRRRADGEAEGGAQRLALRTRQPSEVAEELGTQPVQAGERELHLRLDAGRARNPAPRRARCEVLEQRRLADTRLAAEDEQPALSAPHAGRQPIQLLALTPTAQQPRRWEMRVAHARVALSRPRAHGHLGGATVRSRSA
jgi:hypothetical protein